MDNIIKKLCLSVLALIVCICSINAGTIYKRNPRIWQKLDFVGDSSPYIDYDTTTYRLNITTDVTTVSNINSGGMVRQTRTWHVFGGTESANTTFDLTRNVWQTMSNSTQNLWTGQEFDGFTLNGDTMTVLNSGDYSGTLSFSFEGSLTKDYAVRVYNITQAAVSGFKLSATGNGSNNYVTMTLPIYLEANANDEFVVQVTNTSGNEDLVLHDAVFYIQYLHD